MIVAPYVPRHMVPFYRRNPYTTGALSTAGAAGTALLAYGAKRYYSSSASKAVGAAATAARKYVSRQRRKPVQSLSSNANSNARPRKPRRARRKYKTSKIVKLSRAVHQLKRSAESDEGLLVYRRRTTARCLAAVNAAGYAHEGVVSAPFCEAVLAQLKYYNPSTPGTLTTADGTTGTFMKDFQFAKLYAKIGLRNNYQVPCKVSVYSCKVREDTFITTLTAMTNGLTDVGAPASDSPIVYPTDSPQFVDLWRVVSTDKKVLQPGEEMIVGYACKSFQYDPSLVDSQTADFQVRYNGFAFLIRVEGVIAHDSSADQQGTIAAGVDYYVDRTVHVKYSAGADIQTVYVDNQSDAFTNGALVSSKPVADNIPYSVS